MPVWYKKVKKWVDSGDLVMLGITQEQHPDRCRLFAQWQEFDWPILHDPINSIGIQVVPVVIAIDEWGVVRNTRPRPDTFEADFMGKKFEKPEGLRPAEEASVPDLSLLRRASGSSWQAELAYADACLLWNARKQIDEAADHYRLATEDGTIPAEDRGTALFRLGVAELMRFESPGRQPGDFQAAVNHWQQALDANPNHYIRRRRIQQYGPRLVKPYPFYDWVEQAQADVRGRGRLPVELASRLSGAEIARPRREFPAAATQEKNPDPRGRIARDAGHLVRVESATAPARVLPGGVVRVHVMMRPAADRSACWNNEAGRLTLWVDAPGGWQAERRLWESDQPKEPESTEMRRIEFELRLPKDASPGRHEIRCYALYYVCEHAGGQCLYQRQDIRVTLQVDAPSGEAGGR